jgi:hypothetical protein
VSAPTDDLAESIRRIVDAAPPPGPKTLARLRALLDPETVIVEQETASRGDHDAA